MPDEEILRQRRRSALIITAFFDKLAGIPDNAHRF
jgi:hypothetical protein